MKIKYPFYFKVLAYNSCDCDYYTNTGFGISETLAEATEQIESQYGEELCAILHLEPLEANNFIFLPETQCLEYTDNDFAGSCEIENEIITDKRGVCIAK